MHLWLKKNLFKGAFKFILRPLRFCVSRSLILFFFFFANTDNFTKLFILLVCICILYLFICALLFMKYTIRILSLLQHLIFWKPDGRLSRMAKIKTHDEKKSMIDWKFNEVSCKLIRRSLFLVVLSQISENYNDDDDFLL